MSTSVLTFVVIVANVLGGGMAAPQARKIVRSRRIEGVSLVWAALSVTVNAWWGAYGLAVGDMGIVPVSVVSVMAYLLIGVCIVRFSDLPAWRLMRPGIAAVIAVSIIPVIALVMSSWAVAGIALGALYGVQLAPAVITVYRARDVSGVSLATWVIALVEATFWGAYGLAQVDAGLLTLAATGMLMSSLVLARLFVRRPRRLRVHVGADLPAFAPA